MPPKKGSPKKKKMKEIAPAEMFYLEKVQPNKSVLSRSRLPDECSLEVDEFAPSLAVSLCTHAERRVASTAAEEMTTPPAFPELSRGRFGSGPPRTSAADSGDG